jgi:hypothetical protein
VLKVEEKVEVGLIIKKIKQNLEETGVMEMLYNLIEK